MGEMQSSTIMFGLAMMVAQELKLGREAWGGWDMGTGGGEGRAGRVCGVQGFE